MYYQLILFILVFLSLFFSFFLSFFLLFFYFIFLFHFFFHFFFHFSEFDCGKPWFTVEGFQVLLKAQVEYLIKIGVDTKLKVNR